MLALYKKGKIDSLLDLMKKSIYLPPNAYNEIIVERNKRWIKKMPELMNEQSVFFAVGVTNLGGKDGLLVLLKNLGYTVKAIR